MLVYFLFDWVWGHCFCHFKEYIELDGHFTSYFLFFLPEVVVKLMRKLRGHFVILIPNWQSSDCVQLWTYLVNLTKCKQSCIMQKLVWSRLLKVPKVVILSIKYLLIS